MPAQYPNNLNEIYGGSSVAAMNATLQQQANAEAQDRLDQQRQTLANQFSEQANPIKVQQEQANLDTTRAELPGKQAQSRILGTTASIGEATQDSDIKSKLASNLAKMSSDEVTQHGNVLRGLAGIANMIDQGSPLPLDMQQSMEQKYPGMLQKMQDPATRQKIIQGSNFWAELDQEHQRSMAKQQLVNTGHENVARINAEARIQAALAKARDHGTAASSLEKALTSGNPEAVAAAYDRMAQTSEDPNQQQYYAVKSQEYRQRANQVVVLRRPPGIDIPTAASGGGIQAPPIPQAPAPILPGGAKKEADGSITIQ